MKERYSKENFQFRKNVIRSNDLVPLLLGLQSPMVPSGHDFTDILLTDVSKKNYGVHEAPRPFHPRVQPHHQTFQHFDSVISSFFPLVKYLPTHFVC